MVVPTIQGRRANRLCFAPLTETALYGSTLLQSPLAFSVAQLPNDYDDKLGIKYWSSEYFDVANTFADSFHSLRILVSQLGEYASCPEEGMTEASVEVLQEYFASRSEELSQFLQSFIDSGEKMASWVNQIDDEQVEEHAELFECVHTLSEIFSIVIPNETGELRLTVDAIDKYVADLESLSSTIEAIRLTLFSYGIKLAKE